MTTETSLLDTTELKQRVKRMYEEVALEPEHEFHFETGFDIEAWRENADYQFVSERADNATQKYGVTSISLLAVRR